MTQKRFDLASVSRFQSRLGDLTKGGLVRNGFVEPRADKDTWSWMRPALVLRSSAPIVGTGLGLLIAGTTLFGLYIGTSGTATSKAL